MSANKIDMLYCALYLGGGGKRDNNSRVLDLGSNSTNMLKQVKLIQDNLWKVGTWLVLRSISGRIKIEKDKDDPEKEGNEIRNHGFHGYYKRDLGVVNWEETRAKSEREEKQGL